MKRKKPYTKRNATPPDQLYYGVPEDARTRILAVLHCYCDHNRGGMERLLVEVGNALFKEYGQLFSSSYAGAQRSDNPAVEHFYCCDHDYALDFIEACFQQPTYIGGQKGVDEINEIFSEQGIGFSITPYAEVELETPAGTSLFGRQKTRKELIVEHPIIIRRDNQFAHQEIIEPVLKLLTDSRLRVANQEMLKAHAALRATDFEDSITLACSAFESFLKTICEQKGWSFDPNKDTCAKLVSCCLIPAMIEPSMESVAGE